MRRAIGVGFVALVLTAAVFLSQHRRLATTTDPARAASATPAVFSPADNADPYEAYFSGHWCNCWRRTKISPPEAVKMFEGVLPRSYTPPWGKHKLMDMTGLSPQEQLLMQAFEGITGRRVPIWYQVRQGDFWLSGNRAFWKDGITGPPLLGIFGANADPLPQQLGYRINRDTFLYGVKRFCNELAPPQIKGAVIYDAALLDPNAKPSQPREVLNVVRTIAGVESALPLTPELYQALTGARWTENDNGAIPDRTPLPVIYDARQTKEWDLANFGGNEAEAARAAQTWALNTEGQYCLKHALCFVPPIGPGGTNTITDYSAEFGLFTFYVGGDTKGDERQLELILSQAPFNIPIVGTITDKTGAAAEADRVRLTRLFSRFGKYFVDATGADNLSFHTAERPVERQKFSQAAPQGVNYEAGKLYVAFAVTTGNSLGQFQQNRPYHWDCAARGSVPIGWAVPLTAADTLPNVMKYYYHTASENDCFIADLSGLGRINPQTYGAAAADPKAELVKYLQDTDAYLGYAGVSLLWAEELDDNTQKLFADSLPNMQALIYGTQAAPDYLTRSAYTVSGKPVLQTVTDLADSKAALAALSDRLAAMKSGFALVGVDETQFAANEDVAGAIAAAAAKLPANAVVVRPDQLAALYKSAAQARLVPTTPPTLLTRWQSGNALAIEQVSSGAVSVDGSLAEWPALGATKVPLTARADIPANDLSAVAYAAFDDQYLYLAAHVRDDVVYADDYNLTRGDGLELLLDARQGRFREPKITEGAYRLFLTPAAGLVKEATLTLEYPTFDIGLVSMNKHGIEEKVVSRRTSGGYDLEAAIPLANFPRANWTKGAHLAFALAVNDQDKGRFVENRLQSTAGDFDRSLLYLQPATLG